MLFIGPGQEGKAVRRDVFKFVSAVFGAAMYLALSIWLGWLGWRTPPPATEMPNNETGNITT